MTTDAYAPEETVGGDGDEWRSLPADPDPERDLGYRLIDLEVVPAPVNEQTMFLPSDEEMLKEEAFVIVADDVVVDVLEYR